MPRRFTKYPSNYIKADTEVSVEEFDALVDSYRDSGLGWSVIVAELKGKYGLDTAKAVADSVCYERKSINASTEFTDIYNKAYDIIAENGGSTYKARLYLDDLVRRGVLSKADATTMIQDIKETYDL